MRLAEALGAVPDWSSNMRSQHKAANDAGLREWDISQWKSRQYRR